ncbi:helix-turn-helix domain-containing protein [Amphritea sp.]|uniref:helix-turn-helix domain-containing protein n=1 Tax=Amphritea sp. TaxID=1872502 RepID=UPI0025C14B05|nr:XRE family transcriptional regulator [Amphritea sp.]
MKTIKKPLLELAVQEVNQYLATTLKKLRQEKSWSLDRAASETGVSKAMLGQIERGESSPTISTMWKISTGFHKSLSSFLEPPVDPNNETIIRVTSTRHTPLESDNAPVTSIFPYDERFGFEMFELTLLPGYQRISEPHMQGTTEHIIVICGEMELLLEGEWIKLTRGEAVRFTADKLHGYRNNSTSPAVFHNVIHYDQGSCE